MAYNMSNVVKCCQLLRYKSHMRLPKWTMSEANNLFRNGGSIFCLQFFHNTKVLDVDPIPIKMPKLSPTMEGGTIVKWYKKEGDTISPGDVLCDVETDKATVAMEWEDEGVLAKLLVLENTRDIKIGTLIAVMVAEGEDWRNVTVPVLADSSRRQAPDVASDRRATNVEDSTGVPSPDTAKSTIARQHDGHLIGPAVKQLMHLYHIDLNNVSGSGRHGAVLKGDLLRAIKEKSLKPTSPPTAATPAATPTAAKPIAAAAAPRRTAAPKQQVSYLPPRDSATYHDVELTGMRRTIAKHVTESKTTVPHAYAMTEATIDAILELRKKLLTDDIKLSLNDFVIKAAASALKSVPSVNGRWTEEGVVLLPEIDISVAVATPDGLITPIVRNVDKLGLESISAIVKDLSQRASDGTLLPEEFIGGSFSISNLGMFGISEFTAIIRPPQSCILAVGAAQIQLTHENTTKTLIRMTLSSDGRVVDDFMAARFLAVLKQNLEHPEMLFTGLANADVAAQVSL